MMNNKLSTSRKLISVISVLVILITISLVAIFLQKSRNYLSQKDIQSLDAIYSNNQNQRADYSLRIIPFDAGTAEGAEMKVFFDKSNGSTKIIEASYGGETFRMQFDYYFEDINKFVLIQRNEEWDRPFYAEDRLKIKDEINKYYFINLTMVHGINFRGIVIDPTSKEFKRKESDVLIQLKKFTDLISQPQIIR